MTLRVKRFNVRNGRAFGGWDSWLFRRRSLVDTITGLDASVIGLQEVFAFQRRWLMSRLPHHTAYGVGRGRFRFGEQCPILARQRWGIPCSSS